MSMNSYVSCFYPHIALTCEHLPVTYITLLFFVLKWTMAWFPQETQEVHIVITLAVSTIFAFDKFKNFAYHKHTRSSLHQESPKASSSLAFDSLYKIKREAKMSELVLCQDVGGRNRPKCAQFSVLLQSLLLLCRLGCVCAEKKDLFSNQSFRSCSGALAAQVVRKGCHKRNVTMAPWHPSQTPGPVPQRRCPRPRPMWLCVWGEVWSWPKSLQGGTWDITDPQSETQTQPQPRPLCSVKRRITAETWPHCCPLNLWYFRF